MEANKILQDGKRFYLETQSGTAEILYKVSGNSMSIYHTFVPEGERGKGIAEKLASEAFEFARRKGMKVKPDCPYIPKFLAKHPEYAKDSV